MNKNQKFKVIKVSEVRISPRGRKAQYDADLLAVMASLGEDDAIVVSCFGSIPKDGTTLRATVSQKIRKHWAASGRTDDCRIAWDNETGFPQVAAKKP